MQHQLARLLAGGLAVVAGDVERDVRRQESAARLLDALEHGVRHHGGIGALALGHRDRDGLLHHPLASRARHVARRLGEVVGDRRHVAHVHRGAAACGDEHAADVGGGGERGADGDLHAPPRALERARAHARVRARERLRHLPRRHAARGEPRGVERDTELSRLATHDERARDVAHRTDLVAQVQRELSQRVRVVHARVQREREHRHIIDRVRRHHGRHRAGGEHDVVELRAHAGHAPLLILAHREPHGHHRVAVARQRVHVVHARDLEHRLLDGARQQLLGLARREPGHRRHDVDHRYRDLRLFLARRGEQAEQSQA